jgi:UDPglucose 6-dehydrogenase
MNNTHNIGVIGIGRLGLSFALLAEKQGYKVIGCDKRGDYLDLINTRTYTTSEPFINEYLQTSKLDITDLSGVVIRCDTIFCFVATPSLPDGSYDHSAIDDIVDQLAKIPHVGYKTFVIGCTVMPGYTESIRERMDKMGYGVAYNPEFIAQGSIIDGLRNADMVLMGVTEDSTYEALKAIYRTIMDKEPVISRMSPTAAEITKIAINCFLTMKITYANMVGEIAINSAIEDEIPTILQAIGSDSRIGHKYLRYGFGVGGVCLPRDQRALGVYMEDIGIKARLPSAIDNTNNYHAEFLVQYYMTQNPSRELPFQFTQLTYKKGVDILTESQQYHLCRDLLEAGYTVAIDETSTVIQQVQDELQQYGDRVVYGTIDNAYKIDI